MIVDDADPTQRVPGRVRYWITCVQCSHSEEEMLTAAEARAFRAALVPGAVRGLWTRCSIGRRREGGVCNGQLVLEGP